MALKCQNSQKTPVIYLQVRSRFREAAKLPFSATPYGGKLLIDGVGYGGTILSVLLMNLPVMPGHLASPQCTIRAGPGSARKSFSGKGDSYSARISGLLQVPGEAER